MLFGKSLFRNKESLGKIDFKVWSFAVLSYFIILCLNFSTFVTTRCFRSVRDSFTAERAHVTFGLMNVL